MNTDPGEVRNVFGEPGQQDRVLAMTAQLREWQVANGDVAELG